MDDYKKIEIRHFATSSCDKHYLLYCLGKYYEANQQMIMLLHALQFHLIIERSLLQARAERRVADYGKEGSREPKGVRGRLSLRLFG